MGGVAMADEMDLRLELLSGGPRKAHGESCPAAEEWASLAAGTGEPGRRDELLEHASSCDSCGALLHALVEDFSPERENAPLEMLASSRAAWQLDMSRRMAGAASRGRVIPMSIRPWMARAAAVVLAAGAGWMAWDRWSANDPERLIAQAYTQQRPFEFRIGSAANAPVRVERGRANRPAALIEAEAAIAGKLQSD